MRRIEWRIHRASLTAISAAIFLTYTLFSPTAAAQTSSVTQLTPDVYLFQKGFHSNIFVVTTDGVVATDPISPSAAKECLAEIRKITDQPVRYVIYSHDHTDHIAGGAVFRPHARFVAHRSALAAIRARENPQIIAPDVLVDDHHSIEIGGKTIQLTHMGRIESASNLVIYIPQDKVLMWVDAVRSFGVPYRYLEGTDLRDFRNALEELRTWEFDHLVPGHGGATDKTRLELYARYFEDLERHTIAEMARNTQLEHRATMKNVNPERFFDSYISKIAARVIEHMRADYGELGGFDDWSPKNAERMVVHLLHERSFDYRANGP